MLATARAETGLAIVTEVMAPEHVPVVAEYADVLQIGPATCKTTSCFRPWETRESRPCSSVG